MLCIGYFAGKFQKIDKETISSLLFYFIAPITISCILIQSNLKVKDFLVILVVFSFASCLSMLGFFLSSKFWKDNHRNILAFSAGTSNGSFIALPIANALFDSHTLGIYVLVILGIAIYEISVGYYICSLTQHKSTLKENFVRIVKLPIFLSFIFGASLSLCGIGMPAFLSDFSQSIQNSIAVLGMILVGVSVSEVKQFKLDFKFLAVILFFKFILFPAFFNIFVLLDKYIFKIFSKSYHYPFQLLSVTPISVSVVITSIIFNLYPEKTSTAILVSLLISLVYTPLTLQWLIF